MIEAVPVAGSGLLWDGSFGREIVKRRSIDEENIEPAVVVVIEESDAGSHRLGQVMFRRVRGLVLEIHAQRGSDIDKICGCALGLIGSSGRLLRGDDDKQEQP